MTQREKSCILNELSPPIEVLNPARQTVPLVFSSPHSGRIYPTTLLDATRLTLQQLRRSEDFAIDELFAPVVGLGAPLLAARFPRVYVDVNREPYELDPSLFHDRVPEFANTRSLRVVGGLGTIARVVGDSEEIYRERMPISAALERIERLHKPYHRTLNDLLTRSVEAFGYGVLIDCHSMPSGAAAERPAGRPDIVIGDRFGTSCDPMIVRFLRSELSALGYDVALNRPYAGGYITEHFGQPRRSVHALQIEIGRSLYMDEQRIAKSGNFASVQQSLVNALARLIDWLPGRSSQRLAAE